VGIGHRRQESTLSADLSTNTILNKARTSAGKFPRLFIAKNKRPGIFRTAERNPIVESDYGERGFPKSEAEILRGTTIAIMPSARRAAEPTIV
jgi:hypothetical protein